MTESLRIIPLGGLGEIGKNMTLFEYGRDILIVDVGLMFPANDMLGVDLVLPDWNYLREAERAERIAGIVITHGHEDHIGALPYLIRDLNLATPIFGTRMVQGLVEGKLKEANLYKQCPQITVDEGETFPVGPFDLEFIAVTHSIP
ncbi:MAG TPA: ribonuclease J, partial [Anaerolineae bacterium]|nr:ribonuclease J [Anaerolineae bacterium]